MPILTMLVGLPGSGKSTFLKNNEGVVDAFIYSTDNFIEDIASERGLTYDEVFQETIDEAVREMNLLLKFAYKEKRDIYWDQTNMSAKKRRGIFSNTPKEYKKFCVCIQPPQNDSEWFELYRRLGERPGKTIHVSVLNSMKNSYQEPSLDEGSNDIKIYDLFGNLLKHKY